ncbi:MAG TPA: hypothetical protein VJI71_03015 [Candidatus Norongarragalinales archaeon]|nr:hypothetical protein [Candidatus Norongarragalinales archaeon]
MDKFQKGFVCLGGCNGITSEEGKTCGASDCPSHGHPLVSGFKCLECGETFAEGEKHEC